MKAKNVADIYELSPMQQGLLFHTLHDPNSIAYFDQNSFTLRGNLNISAFKRAWEIALEQHSILRTSFHWATLKKPVQVVHQQIELPWQELDWREQTSIEQQENLRAFLAVDRAQGFEMTTAPLLRLTLIHLTEDTYQFTFSKHHILLDGWSRLLVFKEVFNLYTTLTTGETFQLPPSPSFRNYITWLRQQDSLQAETFWRKMLQGFIAPTPLGVDQPVSNPLSTTDPYTVQRLDLPQIGADLQQFARQHQLTPTTLVLAAWSLLLSRYSGESDVVFGITSSGRPASLSGVEAIAGLFINTLPVRVQVNPEATLVPWLQQFQAGQVEMRQYEYSSLVQIQGWSELPRGVPLFESLVITENYPVDTSLQRQANELNIEGVLSFGRSHYPLSLVIGLGSQVFLELTYDDRRFNADTINRLLGHLQTLLTGMIVEPNQRLKEIPLLTAKEQQTLVKEWNQTSTEIPELCLHEWVEAQVQHTPTAIALRYHDTSLTYDTLNQRANHLAHHLQQAGVTAGTRVGLFLDRSPTLLIALLAVLKAGGTYVPLDPAYPTERLTFILSDAQVALLLTDTSLETLFPFAGRVLPLDSLWNNNGSSPRSPQPCSVTPDALVYILYTSGSTGRPKGVQIPHRAVVNFLSSMQQDLKVRPGDVLLAVTSLSFDIAVLELLLPLVVGATVELVDRATAVDGQRLAATLTRTQATFMQATPATWRLLLEAGWQGRSTLTLLCGGEALTPDLAAQLLPRAAALWNLYGPTETTIWSTRHRLTTATDAAVVGHPLSNTQLYILDQQQQPVPIGVVGELYIGGAGVARGYVGRADLTAARFVPDAFSAVPGARLYRTGDRVKYRADGSVEYVGRVDDQVKLRGFRIELGEIEAVLSQHPQVRQAVVLLTGEHSQQYLCAFLVLEKDQTIVADELRFFLKEILPQYMIPSTFIVLESLPLTPNRKIDRQALAAIDSIELPPTTSYIQPETPDEQQLATIWMEILGVQQVGTQDNFFDLGGHSILVIQLWTRIKELFQVEIPLRSLFEAPTITEQVKVITNLQQQVQFTQELVTTIAVDLRKEAVLDVDIQPETEYAIETSPPDAILLTGATGFLGAFLLHQLLQQTSATIYCLVRASTIEQARERLQRNLEAYALWNQNFAHRILPVLGDLAQPKLGLTSDQFQTLADRIDVIYHNGALVNFVYSYSTLKAANVLGTQEVLRLAAMIRTKPVHFISTFSVFSNVDRLEKIEVREEDTPEACESLQSGYAQSKWVSERLAAIANSRGIPVCIYRLGRITGDTQTGICNTDDFMSRMIKGCIQIGYIPEPDSDTLVDMTPVDYASQVIVHLSQQQQLLGQVFHVVNPTPIRIQQLLNWLIGSSGYSLKAVSYEQWREELIKVTKSSQDNALYPLLPRFLLKSTEESKDSQLNLSESKFDCRNTLKGLQGTSISCPQVSDKLLKTYFQYYKQSNYLKSPSTIVRTESGSDNAVVAKA
ncbi:non-ribosomal peptide synthetase [Myxacorys almedinensis]|uniref:Amino acid adenylation domain-containing protein n=1 Tax=Myxacorys almedinensis A TaxID=2690445 RepID=A0A8J8CJ30_9CYAN|nr:non-ribosomal peptide synthetase [Myxacorys almedinensis]NDJ18573.1 amino acid adenylation domain-containing protein [Myxacorys almedinensis A]